MLLRTLGRWLARRELAHQRREVGRLFGLYTKAADDRDAARADLAEARRELETARLDAQMRTRAHGDAMSAAARGRIEALARLKSIETQAREGREFLEN